jgi:hypothetical protein
VDALSLASLAAKAPEERAIEATAAVRSFFMRGVLSLGVLVFGADRQTYVPHRQSKNAAGISYCQREVTKILHGTENVTLGNKM